MLRGSPRDTLFARRASPFQHRLGHTFRNRQRPLTAALAQYLERSPGSVATPRRTTRSPRRSPQCASVTTAHPAARLASPPPIEQARQHRRLRRQPKPNVTVRSSRTDREPRRGRNRLGGAPFLSLDRGTSDLAAQPSGNRRCGAWLLRCSRRSAVPVTSGHSRLF